MSVKLKVAEVKALPTGSRVKVRMRDPETRNVRFADCVVVMHRKTLQPIQSKILQIEKRRGDDRPAYIEIRGYPGISYYLISRP